MMLKYAVIIACQFKNMFPIEQVPVFSCELEVIVNTLLTGSQEFPCSSFHTWTLQYLQQFAEFRNVQETLAGTAKQNANKEKQNRSLSQDSTAARLHRHYTMLTWKKRVLSSLTAINQWGFYLFINRETTEWNTREGLKEAHCVRPVTSLSNEYLRMGFAS